MARIVSSLQELRAALGNETGNPALQLQGNGRELGGGHQAPLGKVAWWTP